MADQFASKPGKDQGFDPRNNQAQPVPAGRIGQEEASIPPDADLAVWDDEYNYDPSIARLVPRNGVECTSHALFHSKGVSVDNDQKDNYVYKPGRS